MSSNVKFYTGQNSEFRTWFVRTLAPPSVSMKPDTIRVMTVYYMRMCDAFTDLKELHGWTSVHRKSEVNVNFFPVRCRRFVCDELGAVVLQCLTSRWHWQLPVTHLVQWREVTKYIYSSTFTLIHLRRKYRTLHCIHLLNDEFKTNTHIEKQNIE